MNPRMIALSGPMKDRVISLAEAEVTVGRESSNHIHLADLSVSRRHCVFRSESGQVMVTDLDSFNGTSVNDVPVKERLLAHGDRIRVGDSTFLFLLRDGETAPLDSGVRIAEGSEIIHETVRLRQEDALYLQPDRLIAALPKSERLARDLNALLKISAAINSIRGLEELQSQLLEMIGSAIPAEWGAIILFEENSEEPASITGWRRDGDQPMPVSRTILRRVLNEGVSLLSNDLLKDAEGVSADSLLISRARSLVAVPIVMRGKTTGVIYLATSDPIVWFDEDHLQLAAAVAGIAGVALENARHVAWLEGENRRLQSEIVLTHNLVGESERMRSVLNFIAKVAPTDSTVLIRGETGVGKELGARAIHVNSRRAECPFVAINCAALTETLLESELFGHEKGAFTGATSQKKGKFEMADGGTIFLDELGEMSMALQVKLLRALQEQEFERVGGTRVIKVNVRLIAATNRDLEAMIKQGIFRQDLYYRLNVVSLVMPPLRERREDIPLLANYFATKYAQKCNRHIRGVSPEARACLKAYDWPGNVRELENAIERAIVLGSSDLIRPEDLPEAVLESEGEDALSTGSSIGKYHETIRETKKQLILMAVDQTGGNVTEAAKLLGVQANYLHRLISNLNLRPALKK
ncbi:MAG: sigma 54-interacting transcriptional regulator [Acidobacteria bacterium]|nr:sigma 54-interacting transcriptional regulator [Acidobacteriota bacterium]